MTGWLVVPVLVLAAVTTVVLVIGLVRDEHAQDRTFALLAALEVVLLVQLVVGCVLLAGTDRDVSGGLFVSYLVLNVFLLPVGAFLSLAERTRSGTGLLLVAVVSVAFLQLRLEQIWAGAGA